MLQVLLIFSKSNYLVPMQYYRNQYSICCCLYYPISYCNHFWRGQRDILSPQQYGREDRILHEHLANQTLHRDHNYFWRIHLFCQGLFYSFLNSRHNSYRTHQRVICYLKNLGLHLWTCLAKIYHIRSWHRELCIWNRYSQLQIYNY